MSDALKSDDAKRVKRIHTVRLYAGAGLAFWIVAAIVAYVQGASNGTIVALATLAAGIAAALLVGWFHETAGAIVMLAAAISTVAYGVLVRWDLAFWGMMLVSVTGPMLVAAYLFDAVRRQDPDSEGTQTSAPTGAQAHRAS
jgi:hypothetical protein